MGTDINVRIGAKEEVSSASKKAVKAIKGIGDQSKKTTQSLLQTWSQATIVIAGVTRAWNAAKTKVLELADAYGEQQDAELKLAQAVANNPMINGDGARRLAEYASSMQDVSRFGDEALIANQAFVANLGYAEEQIEAITLASVELASTGKVNLDSAFRNVTKTMSGMTGELGELIPGIKELTKEELQAGDGVQYIIEQFSGMKDASIAGLTGFREQVSNTVGDIKEKLGGIFADIFEGSGGRGLKDVLDKLDAWLEEYDEKIVNFFLGIPEIASIAFQAIGEMWARTFEWDSIKNVVSAMLEQLVSNFRTQFEFIGDIWKSIWNKDFTIGDAIANRTQSRVDTTKDFYSSVGSNYSDIVAAAVEQINALLDQPRASSNAPGNGTPGTGTPGGGGDSGDEITNPEGWFGSDYYAAYREAQNIADEKFVALYGDKYDHYLDYLKAERSAATSVYESMLSDGLRTGDELFDDALLTLRGVITATDEELEKIAYKAQHGLLGSVWTNSTNRLYQFDASTRSWIDLSRQPGSNAEPGTQFDLTSASPGSMYTQRAPSFADRITEMAERLEDAVRGGFELAIDRGQTFAQRTEQFLQDPVENGLNMALDGVLAFGQSIGSLVSQIGGVIGSFASVVAIMNPLQTIFTAMGQVLAPVVNQLLTPIVGILAVLGQALGQILVPAFQALEPVITKLSEVFIWLYNKAIVPLGNGIAQVLAAIVSSVSYLVEGLSTWIHNLFHPLDKRAGPGSMKDYVGAAIEAAGSTLSTINMEDLTAAGTNYLEGAGAVGVSGGGIYGGSTTVQRQPDINVYISAEQVNGPGGMAEFGRLVADAIVEYTNVGGKVQFLEAV